MKKHRLLKFSTVFLTVIFFVVVYFSWEALSGTIVNLTLTTNRDLEHGLVGHWTFDGKDFQNNATDRSGSGNHGYLDSFIATSTAIAAGRIGQALSENFVNVIDSNTLDFAAADDFTLSAWVRHYGSLSTTSPAIWKQDTTNGGYYLYMDISGNLCFAVDDDGNWVDSLPDDSACTSGKDHNDDTWNHVTGIKKGTTDIRLYVDGSEKASDTSIAAASTLENSSTFDIGVGPSVVGGNEVAIDTDLLGNNVQGYKDRPQMVFISDQVGYMFFVANGITCHYRKTTDGGKSWGSRVGISATECRMISVWYDQWTPGDTTGTFIHIVFGERLATDAFYYERLDTADDSQLGEVAVNDVVGASVQWGDYLAITKATNEVIYLGAIDDDSAGATKVMQCSSNCGVGGSWSDVGTSPLATSDKSIHMIPLSNGDMMLIRRERTLDDMQSNIWNGSTWEGWTTIDANAPDSALQPHRNAFTATVDKRTNDVYLVYTADVAVSTADVRTAIYSSGSWTSKADVITDQNTITTSNIAIDENTGDVYAAYLRGTDGTFMNAYYKVSTDGMETWGGETQFNTTNSNLVYVGLNMMSNERIYGYYHQDDTNDSVFGVPIVDLVPPWDGALDDIRVYNRALSPAEITRLYHLGATTKINTTLTTNPDLEDGLVGHWTFDGKDVKRGATLNANGIIDRSGQGNNGRLVGQDTSTTTAQGKIGQAISFDGTDDYVDVGNVAGSGTNSVAFWIRADDITSRKILRGNSDPIDTVQIELDGSSNIIATNFASPTVYIDGTTPAKLLTNGWHHVVVVENGSGFLDQVEIGRVTSSYFDGVLDDIRIYNRALSQNEITRLYKLGVPQ